MLEVILVCIVFGLAIYFLGKFFRNKISKAANSVEAVKIRRQFRNARMVIKILFGIIMLAEIIYLIIASVEVPHSLAQKVLMWVVIIGAYTFSAMSLPITGITLSQFKEIKKDYALYLRGFATDDYTPLLENRAEYVRDLKNYGPFVFFKKKEDPQDLPFSEREFQKALDRYLPLYSVGMTRELESPEGAKRIYLDDETWQDDVSYLIEHAKYIFIRVNSSDNCIWEINKAQEVASNRVVFIIDNTRVVSVLNKKLDGKLPDGLRLGIHEHTAIVKKQETYVEHSYRNNLRGYRKLLKKIL